MMFNWSVCYKQGSVSFYDSIPNENGSKSDCNCASRYSSESGCSFSIGCSYEMDCSSGYNCSFGSRDDVGDDVSASGSNSEKSSVSGRDSYGEAGASSASDAPPYSEHNGKDPLLRLLFDILTHHNCSA